jgi:hypothetical protein
MTRLVQGALETRFSYAAPDNVLNQDIGDLSSATFDTGATITGTSPTDTTDMTEVLLEAYTLPRRTLRQTRGYVKL